MTLNTPTAPMLWTVCVRQSPQHECGVRLSARAYTPFVPKYKVLEVKLKNNNGMK
jgi:hypothetical protein